MNQTTYLTSCKTHQNESTLLPEVKARHSGGQKREAWRPSGRGPSKTSSSREKILTLAGSKFLQKRPEDLDKVVLGRKKNKLSPRV